MTIKEVEHLTGIKKSNIRYYEEVGLVKPERESGNNYRNYREQEIEDLKKIKFLRHLGLSVQEIKEFQNKTILFADLIEKRRKELDGQIEELNLLDDICRKIQKRDVDFEHLTVMDIDESRSFQNISKNRFAWSKKQNQLEVYDKMAIKILEMVGSIVLVVSVFFRVQLHTKVPLWFTIIMGITVGIALMAKVVINYKRNHFAK